MPYGIVTAREARAAGLSSEAVRWRIRTGRWQEVLARVYCAHAGPLPPEAWCWAALRYAGAGAVLSHDTAAALLGLRGADLLPVHVTIPADRRVAPQSRLRIHRTRAHGLEYVASRRGLAVHRMERALLDLASARPARAHAALAAGVQQGLTTVARLRGCLLSLPANLAGRSAILGALGDVEGGTRSELEAACLHALRAAGLPEPERDHPLRLPGRRAWLDLCYPDAGIAIEVDGRSFHVWSDAWERDLARQNDVVLAGWLVLRFSGAELRAAPARVAEQVLAALRLRGAA